MNSKSIVAAVVGAVVLFVLGFILYGWAFNSFFMAHSGGSMKEMADANILVVFLGNLSGTVLLTIIFGSWANIKTFAGGLKAGLIFGLFVSIGVDLINLGTTNGMDVTASIVDVILTTVMFAVTGGVVAAMLGRGPSQESTA